MIRLPGLEAFIWMLRVSLGFAVLSALVVIALSVVATLSWRSAHAALWPQRVTFGGLIWASIWTLLNLPSSSTLLALVALAIWGGGFGYISAGNRRRGHQNPRLLIPGVSAVVLALGTLALASFVRGALRDAEERAEVLRKAEAERDQDTLARLALLDGRRFVAIGTTSSAPSRDADAWVATFSIEDGELLDTKTYPRAQRQSGLALCVSADASLWIGGKDEDRPWLARVTQPTGAQYRRWSEMGEISALHALGNDQLLAGGRVSQHAWVGLLDAARRERWHDALDTGIDYARVNDIAVVQENFVAVGSDELFSRGAFLVGGKLSGEIAWKQSFGKDSGETRALTHIRARADGTFVALGRRGRPDSLEDLWLLHVAADGVILDQFTFGRELGEYSGGLALRRDDYVVAGHRFTGVDSVLWLLAVYPNGKVRWEKTYPNAQFGRASDIATLPNGDILVAGERAPAHKADSWIARFDGTGKPLWQRTYP